MKRLYMFLNDEQTTVIAERLNLGPLDLKITVIVCNRDHVYKTISCLKSGHVRINIRIQQKNSP